MSLNLSLISDSPYLDALPEITFDVRSRRWRYRDSKQFAPMDAVRSQAERYLESQKSVLTSLADKYFKGKVDLRQAQTEAAAALKAIHLAEMIRATDKQEQINGDRFLVVARNLRAQYYSGKDALTGDRYGLKYLFFDLEAGKLSQAQLENRLRMFGESGKQTYWMTRSDIAAQTLSEGRRVLNPAEHCENCVEYARRGWVPIAEVVPPTVACQCRTNCKCNVEYR